MSIDKIFSNIVNQNFTVNTPNKIWCIDFTYLPQKNGTMRYNCTIIDLFDRYAVATCDGNHLTTELAVETLASAIKRHKPPKNLVLHSDQGSQFTSKKFNDFCIINRIQQGMSRVGCPYDNAPMERFYNTLKNEYINLFSFPSAHEQDQGIYDFVYAKYNHVRPHSYIGGLTPFAHGHGHKIFIHWCYNFA